MKTFKEWLLEKWEVSTTGTYAANTKKIGGHDVKTYFDKRFDSRRHAIGFKVDDEYSKDDLHTYNKPPPTPENATKIYGHVRKSISSFIRHGKPRGVSFMAYDGNYHDMYRVLARHIAKKHNGILTVNDRHFNISFPQNDE